MMDWNLIAERNADRHRAERLATVPALSPLSAPERAILAERDALAAAQARADSVAAFTGERASAPVPGESVLEYRRRLLGHFQQHSERFKAAPLGTLGATVIGPIEDIVYADAIAKAKRPETPGTLQPVTTFENGRSVTRFYGDIGTWMGAFALQGVSARINRSAGG